MSILVKNLVPSVQLGVAIATHYTATNVRAILDKVTLSNTTGGAITVDLHLVPNGGSATATNKILSAKSIGANSTDTCPEVVGHVLEPGGTIQALASAATSVGLRVSGREVS